MNVKTKLARVKKKGRFGLYYLMDAVFQTDYYWNYFFEVHGYHTHNYNVRKDQIAFVHVPKTGGTSLSKMLEKVKGDRFININIHRPVSSTCPPPGSKYITVMRNPVDRVWSQFQMVRREQPGYPYQSFAVKGLDCFLKRCWMVRNVACQYYSGKMNQPVDEHNLNTALENLNNFYQVIDFDNFSEEVSAFMVKEKLPFEEILHKRKSKYNAPNQQEKKQIEAYNKFDIMLFEKWKHERRSSKKRRS